MTADIALDKIKKAGKTPETIGRYSLMKLLGVGERKARTLLRNLRGNSEVTPNAGSSGKLAESSELAGDRWNVHLPSTRIHTLEQLIEYFEVDLSKWEVSSFQCNKWEMGYVDSDGNASAEPLYQIKATFVKAKGFTLEAVKAEIERLKVAASSEIKKFNINRNSKYSDKGNALEVSIADLHLGKLGHGKETLGANYDHKIAAKLYENAFVDILNRTTVPLERVCIVAGNDLFNCDSRAGLTTKGTVQNNDTRYMKMFEVGFDLLVKQINTCLDAAPVDVMMVSGNHDEHSVWHLGHSLQCYYSGNKNVNINNSPAYRKYWQYGVNMVMMTHGNDIKEKDLPLLLATEMPQMFADTKYREVHLGHKHQVSLFESHGIRVRIIPSLTAPDWWHSQSGYVGQIRAAQGFVWSKANGLIEIKEHCIDTLAE